MNISDSVSVKVTRRIIIQHKFGEDNSKINYFFPRYKKILRGEDVEWVNLDEKKHNLRFYDTLNNNKFLFDLLIKPKSNETRTFDYNLQRIDYLCDLHDAEEGTIILYPYSENKMTSTEQIRFLNKVFKIDPPEIWKHLRS